jgi:hypothetical protein
MCAYVMREEMSSLTCRPDVSVRFKVLVVVTRHHGHSIYRIKKQSVAWSGILYHFNASFLSPGVGQPRTMLWEPIPDGKLYLWKFLFLESLTGWKRKLLGQQIPGASCYLGALVLCDVTANYWTVSMLVAKPCVRQIQLGDDELATIRNAWRNS